MSDAHPIDAVEAHVTSAIRAAMDVCGNEYWLRWAKAWLNGKRRSTEAVETVKRHIKNDMRNVGADGQVNLMIERACAEIVGGAGVPVDMDDMYSRITEAILRAQVNQ